jgi:hypothetical protein
MDMEEDVCDQGSPKSDESDLDESDHSTMSETEESSGEFSHRSLLNKS